MLHHNLNILIDQFTCCKSYSIFRTVKISDLPLDIYVCMFFLISYTAASHQMANPDSLVSGSCCPTVATLLCFSTETHLFHYRQIVLQSVITTLLWPTKPIWKLDSLKSTSSARRTAFFRLQQLFRDCSVKQNEFTESLHSDDSGNSHERKDKSSLTESQKKRWRMSFWKAGRHRLWLHPGSLEILKDSYYWQKLGLA